MYAPESRWWIPTQANFIECSILTQAGLIMNISTSYKQETTQFSILKISARLTDKGFQEFDLVCQYIFGYL